MASATLLWTCVALAALALPARPAQQASEAGRRLFLAHCAGCHGPDGDGGKGASLARPRLRHAPDDAALVQVIRGGIPGTEMPFTRMTDAEARALAEFVRSLGRRPREKLAGDAARGERTFWAKGCGGCHSVGARGGYFGPDLGDVGARRSAGYLRRSLVDPEGDVVENFTVYRRVVSLPDNALLVRVRTHAGDEHTGLRLNEDTFSIQLLEASGRIRSFWKTELAELDKQWRKSPMPSYRDRLQPAELEDLVAYLASLGAAP